MNALDTYLAKQDLSQVQITPADYQEMQRALQKLSNAPSFGGFGGPANFVRPELFDQYLREFQQEELNEERINLIEWLLLMWILRNWLENTNNLKPDLGDTAHINDTDHKLHFPAGLLDRIAEATGNNPAPTKPKSPRLER